MECILSKFAKDTKLCGEVNMLEGRDAIQGYLDRLETWACVNCMNFNMAKCKVPHMGQGNPKRKSTGWAESGLRAALSRRTWGYWWMRSST